MNRKQALIVDDSKTAQYLLKRMLQKYDLAIDIVSSAAEALTYLSYNHPSVIFLDHQMADMTGMEALKTIKANPNTALIPVIMYTSQNDDVFVSQAVALGAHGILSKNAMQPASLQQALARLDIRPFGIGEVAPAAVESEESVAEEGSAQVTTRVNPVEVSELEKVRQQIGRLFEIHVADLRNQINNSTQFVIKRLSTNIEKAASREAGNTTNTLANVKTMVAAAIASERRKRVLGNRILLGVAIVALLVFGYLLLQFQFDAEANSQKILAALEAKKAEKPQAAVAMNGSMPAAAPGEAPRPIPPALLQAVSWAQNVDFHFDYGEQPLSGMRLSNLHQLIYLLAEGGYRGPLVVNINFGNFCLEQDENNAFRLPRSDAKLSACKMQKDLNPRFAVSDYITTQYQVFEKNVAPLQDGRISLRLETSGMSMPRVEYPAVTPQTTAGEWNRAALRNNRISVQFPPN